MLCPIDDGILLRFRKMTEADEQIRMLRKLHRKAYRQFSLFQHFITPVKGCAGQNKIMRGVHFHLDIHTFGMLISIHTVGMQKEGRIPWQETNTRRKRSI